MNVQDILGTKFTITIIIVAFIIIQCTIAQTELCINGECALESNDCYQDQCYEIVGDCNQSKQCEYDDFKCVNTTKKTNICIRLKTSEIGDATISTDEIILPLYGNVDYISEIIDDVTTRLNSITVLSDDDTAPVSNIAMLGDDATTPADDVTTSADDATVPIDDDEDDFTVPEDDSTIPEDDTTVPEDDSTIPEDVTVPTDSPIPDDCYDSIPDCSKYYYLCQNELYKSLMLSLCPFTCGYCEIFETTEITPEICQDMAASNKPSDCPLYSSLCNDSIYKELMKEQCPKTCGFCDSIINNIKITREFTGTVTICRRNCLQINMLLPYYCLIAALPLCITQILTENDLSVEAKITVQLDLNEYNQTNTNKKPFKCEICGKRFITPSKLTTHNRTHTGEKPFKCPVCDKSFNQRSEKPFKCPVCDKSFNQRSNLESHSRTHTGEKPFKCPVCDMSFNQRSNLKSHSRIHTGEKPFKCPECDKSFNQRANLDQHSLIHTSVKPHRCDVCNKQFIQRSNLKKHYQIHLRKKLLERNVCGKNFNQPVQLNYKPCKFNVSSAECSGNCNLVRNKKKHENSAKLPHCNTTAFTVDIINTTILIAKIISYVQL
ncbi:hypothetical protein DINM_001486 [Dirofilaria immitis]|nr:hypothetical protein [Dirofilaria immitis]